MTIRFFVEWPFSVNKCENLEFYPSNEWKPMKMVDWSYMTAEMWDVRGRLARKVGSHTVANLIDKSLNSLRFADDIDLLADTKESLHDSDEQSV